MQSTKRTLLTNVTALLLCFIMLVGTTFAWFTDIATSNGNVIQSGTLDITLAKGTKTDDGWTWSDTDGQAIFNYEKWEPGYTTTAVLAVENHGTLSAKWTAKLELDGTPTILADVIDIYVTSYHNYSTDRPDFNDGTWQKLGTVRDVLDNNGLLLPGETIDPGHRQPILVAIKMRENAGNDYQDMDLGANFNIKILATQASVESDSYDNTYDADAEWPTLDNGYSASAPIDSANLILGALTSEMQIGGNGIGATIPADVKVADGATSLDLTMKKVDNGNLDFVGATNATSFDVHIEGIADDNTQPMIVNLGAVLPKGLTDTELKLYHTENGVPTEMTRVGSTSEFTIHNQYTYNAETGEVSIYVATFSVFTAVEINADDWDGTSDTSWYDASKTEFTLTTAEQFAGFRDLVDGGNTFEGKTVKLGKDIDLAGKSFNPIGYGYAHSGGQVFMGTFDGGNYTIYNLYQNGWELGYSYGTQGGGLFASIKNASIKNLAISGANIVMECVDMGIVVGYAQGECNFENIVVTNSTIANYNRYTGGIVGEVCKGEDKNGDTFTHTFKNVTVDSSVVVSSLWGSFDTSIGGVIGGKWGDANVLMENVIVAAELDVYSDVTAAYQWYAYRRCGMLIGHTEIDSPKKGLNVHEVEFLTCKNVEIIYGDWVNYTYYEFEDQESDTGKRYPWVRAEASPVGNNAAFSNPRYGVPTYNGVKVSDMDFATMESKASDKVVITFHQLYGGGQGVYGNAKHDGVNYKKISDIATTKIKFQNNGGWENLKIEYVFAHDLEIWSTLVEGLPAATKTNDGTYDVYTFHIPTNASSFKVTGTKNGVAVSTSECLRSEFNNSNEIYALNIAGTNLVETRKVTFTPDTTWKSDSARFALYAYDANKHDIWYNLIAEGTNYVCYLPVDYTGADICRMNPNGTDNSNGGNNWNNKWNQTPNITLSGNEDYDYKTKIYLVPNSNWTQSNARFAAYFFNGNSNTWVSMTYNSTLGVYECEIPSGTWSNVIFCRMNGGTTANNWNNKWNQTGDLTFFGEKKYSVPSGWWDTSGNDYWTYFSNGQWYK